MEICVSVLRSYIKGGGGGGGGYIQSEAYIWNCMICFSLLVQITVIPITHNYSLFSVRLSNGKRALKVSRPKLLDYLSVKTYMSNTHQLSMVAGRGSSMI